MRSAKVAVLPKSAMMRPGESSGNGYIIVLTMCAMGASFISMYSVIVVMFGMLPGLIAMIVDQDPRRYISKIVLTFNATGVVPYLAKIISSKGTSSVAIEIIVEPKTWLVIYAAASVGWFIYWIFPQMALFLFNLKSQIRIQKLNYDLEKLVEEWGDDIKTK